MTSEEHDAASRNSGEQSGGRAGAKLDRNAPLEASDTDEWWVDRFILRGARDSMLWALGFVVLAHFAGFIASAVLAAVRTAHPVGVSISLLLLAGTALSVRAEVRRKGKAAGLTWLLLATWALSGIVAYVGDRYGLL